MPQNLIRVTSELDSALFTGYIDVRITQLTQLLRSGILDPNIDWFETPKPTEIRPYMFGTLVYLVRVHAQLSSAAPSLLERGLTMLVDALASEALRSFKQVRRFGMGGMLRATLEIEFLQQTLARYLSRKAEAALADLYKHISTAYVRKDKDESLQTHLDGVKKTLAEARRATGVEFLCFRTDKAPGSSSSKDQADGHSQRHTDGPSTPRKREGGSSRTAGTGASGTRTPRRREDRANNGSAI
jgi:exocyst complex component 2